MTDFRGRGICRLVRFYEVCEVVTAVVDALKRPFDWEHIRMQLSQILSLKEIY